MMNRFSICQAYAQLEADYNVGGWLRERPSNQRRLESVGVQLHRIGYSSPYGRVDVVAEPGEDDDGNDEVREIYMRAVLRWDLPIDAALMRAMRRYFAPEFLAEYPQTAVRADKMPTMSEAAAYELLRRALFIGGETLANFHATAAADNILFYAVEKGESNNAQN